MDISEKYTTERKSWVTFYSSSESLSARVINTSVVLSLGRRIFLWVDQWSISTSYSKWQKDAIQYGKSRVDRYPNINYRLFQFEYKYLYRYRITVQKNVHFVPHLHEIRVQEVRLWETYDEKYSSEIYIYSWRFSSLKTRHKSFLLINSTNMMDIFTNGSKSISSRRRQIEFLQCWELRDYWCSRSVARDFKFQYDTVAYSFFIRELIVRKFYTEISKKKYTTTKPSTEKSVA